MSHSLKKDTKAPRLFKVLSKKDKELPRSFQTVFKNKTQGTPKKDFFKNNTKDPKDSFKNNPMVSKIISQSSKKHTKTIKTLQKLYKRDPE